MTTNGQATKTIAYQGSWAEPYVDYVIPTGTTNCQVNIETAIAAVVALGGGTLLWRGQVPFVQTQAVFVTDDNVHIRADPDVVLKPAASGWTNRNSPYDASFAIAAGIAFIGVDNFSCRGLYVDRNVGTLAGNGIQAVPRKLSAVAAGQKVCTNGVIEDNRVRCTTPAIHQYAIWSVNTEGLRIVRNVVVGGLTDMDDLTQDFGNEGIEVYGGKNIIVANNRIANFGGSGLIVWTEGSAGNDLEGITVVGNEVDYCRNFIAHYAYLYSGGVRPVHIKSTSFVGNTGRRIGSTGLLFLVDQSGGTPLVQGVLDANPTQLIDITFEGNVCTFLPLTGDPTQIAIQTNPFLTSRAIHMQNTLGVTGVIARNIRLMNETYHGSPAIDAAGHAHNFHVPNVEWINVNVTQTDASSPTAGTAPCIYASTAPDFKIQGGKYQGSRVEAAILQLCTRASIKGVDFRDWNLGGSGKVGVSSFGDYVTVADNTFFTDDLTGVTKLVDFVNPGGAEIGCYRRNNRYVGAGYAQNVWP